MESLEVSFLFIPVYLRQYLIGYIYWVSFLTSLFLCCIQFGCLWDNFNQTLHTVSFREIHSIAKERSRFLVWFMPCPFTGPKMFCAGPNVLSQPKNLTAFSASSKTFVPAQKPILLNVNYLFVWHKIWHKIFVTATICK